MLKGTDRYSLYASRDTAHDGPAHGAPRVLEPAMLSPATLRNHVSRQLPEYMIPAEFLFVGTMPLTANGKVDRDALRALSGRADRGRYAYAPPRTGAERSIAAIWSDLLGGRRMGVLDNFFDLGGHSLLVMLALSRMREALQVDIQVREFFESPTIAALARVVDSRRGASQIPIPAVPAQSASIDQQLSQIEG
jgi:hypothetical protein